MGMDVYGISPTSDAGRHFRASVHRWTALATLIEDCFPQLYARGSHWHANVGGGLGSAADSRELGMGLIALVVREAATRAIATARSSVDERFPQTDCLYCLGTGTVNRFVAAYVTEGLVAAHQRFGGDTLARDERVGCPHCCGHGKVRGSQNLDWPTPDDLFGFAVFCIESGGMRIC